MRTLFWLLVPTLLASCTAVNDMPDRGGAEVVGASQTQQPGPRSPLADSVAEALYQRMWGAIDPGSGYRDYRYLEFDWVLWSGVEILRRHHRYSPWEGDFRVATTFGDQEFVAVGNWNSPSPTRVWIDGEEMEGDSAVFLARRAEKMFELDANALLLPFRWADPGVHAVYLDTDRTEEGRVVKAVELTFQGDGLGSEPRYVFWVDAATGLPTRSFEYLSETDAEPNSVTDWTDWKTFGPLRLSTRRTIGGEGEVRFENIRVEDTVPAHGFTGPRD
jgi:hypothetical protein